MMPDPGPVGWILIFGLVAWINLPFGRLRAGASGLSPRRFACLAAPIFLLFAARAALALPWFAAWALLLPAMIGQEAGRLMASGEAEPEPVRWRLAVYSSLLAGLILLLGGPAAAGGDYRRLAGDDEAAPGFRLTDQDGRTTALDDFRGRVVVLTFFYSNCNDVCPLLLGTMELVEDQLAPDELARVGFLAVSVDADRDTDRQLRDFMDSRGLNADNWSLLTGSITDLTGVVADYGVVVRPGPVGDIVHNSVFVVIDPEGRLFSEFHGAETPLEALLADIRAAMPRLEGYAQ